LVLVLTNLFIQLRFLIYDDLLVELTPLQSIVETNTSTVRLDYDIQVRNFRFCKAECNLLLVDAYHQSLLSNETFGPENGIHIQRSYTLDLNMSGSGERIYYLYAICRNHRSLFCRTDGDPTYRSAIATVNKEYSQEEQANLEVLKADLEQVYMELAEESRAQINFNLTVDAIKAVIETGLEPVPPLTQASLQFETCLNAYYRQDLQEAGRLVSELVFPGHKADFEKLLTALESYNSHINILTDLSNQTYLDAYRFYEAINHSTATPLRAIYSELEALPQTSFEVVAGLENLTQLFAEVKGLVENYSQEQTWVEANLSWQMANLSRLLATNLSHSGDLCDRLEEINNLTLAHNSATSGWPSELSHLLEFISDEPEKVDSNGTHLLKGELNLPNDGNLSLEQYFAYINFSLVPDTYCREVAPLINRSLTNRTQILPDLDSNPFAPLVLGEPKKICCIYGICTNCDLNETRYPIVFIHGHAVNKKESPESSIKAFAQIQKKMSDEGLIVNAGDIDYASIGEGYWSQMNVPVGVRATYYYSSYYDTGSLSKVIRKEEGIESYSLRLKELIDMVLASTGAGKVIIVAHSMGGLVSRNYLLLFGDEKVDRLILIATPNQGVIGGTEQFCSWLGDKRACEDMSSESVFMKRLENFVPSIPVHTIIGTGCNTWGEDGDEIVQTHSSELAYATNHYVAGRCNQLPAVFHSELLNPEKYPQVYDVLKEIIWGRQETFVEP